MSNKKSKKASLLLLDEMKQDKPQLEIIKKLLAEGADINFQSQEDGYTALMMAVDADDEGMVSFLLGHGADPLIKNKNNEIAANISQSQSFIYLLLKDSELVNAVIGNDVSAIDKALMYGAEVNARGVGGNTALMIAVENDYRDVVDFLLECGADTSLVRDDGSDVYSLVTDQAISEALKSDSSLSSENKVTEYIDGSNKLKKARLQSLAARGGNKFDISQLEFSEMSPAPSECQISEVEAHFGHQLPGALKAIYIQYNGGQPKLDRFGEYGEFFLSHFYTVNKSRDKSGTLLWAIDCFSRYLGSETLPFAEDYIGGVLFLRWLNGSAEVWLLRCGEEALDDLEHYVDDDGNPISISFVCESIDIFLEGLYAVD